MQISNRVTFMPKTILGYILTGFLLVGLAAIVYVLGGAILTKNAGNGLERYAIGEMEHLDFSSAGDSIPSASFTGPNGQTVSLADFQGRIIMVNFWATWCAPCEKEMPGLGALQRARAGKDFTLVAISVDKEGDADYALRRLGELAGPKTLDFHITTPESGYEVVYDAAVHGFPTTILYDRQGQEIARMSREADWSSPEAVNFIDAILKAY